MEKKILLVDDEDGIRKVLGISLADIGYQVFTAENGQKALEIFRKESPPIILTDIKMPVMNGIDLLKQIKKENPDAEVIMLTGHGDMELAIKCLKLEATDFITKPIHDDALEIALKRANDKIAMRQKLKSYTENLENMVQEQSARLVEAERLAAVGQAVEGLSSALRGISGDLDQEINYFNELPCFVSIHDRQHKVILTNDLYREKLGDHIGKSSWELYSDKNNKSRPCPVIDTFNTGRGLKRRASVRYIDGTAGPVMVHTAPIRDSEGHIELVVEICADIDEVRRLQERLQASRRKYRQLFDEAPCYITVQDRSLTIKSANKLFEKDFHPEIGAFCHQVYKGEDQVCRQCPVVRTFEDGESHQCEMEVRSKTGEPIQVLIQTAPIRNNKGEITRVMEMSTNITQIRLLEDKLSSLGLMIGSVSHGIKGLLTGLDGGMYILDSGFKKENQEQIKQGWDTVRHMAGKIRNMVEDILYYAKSRDLKWETVDVLAFAQDILSTVEMDLDGEDIKITHDFDAQIGDVKLDRGIVRSALMNIMENAVEACHEDRSGSPHSIDFSVHQDTGHIVFTVSDNGIGMDEERKRKLFTPDYSSKGSKGMGLGLFISNRILRSHGGGITMDSKAGKGSSFSVKLPKKQSR